MKHSKLVCAIGALAFSLFSTTTQALEFPSPSPSEDDGRFALTSRGLNSLGDPGTSPATNIALSVPSDLNDFRLEIFDGDVGGLWDLVGFCGGVPDETVFELYRDPNLTGNANPADLLYTWSSTVMPNDDWCELDVSGNCVAGAELPRDASACPAGSAVCNYNLRIDWQTTACPELTQAFKVSVDGQPFLLGGSTIAFQGLGCVVTDPVCQAVLANPNANIRETTYDGSFTFQFLQPTATDMLEFWDGDLDLAGDTDDPNSGPFPPFPTSPTTLPEGMNPGAPQDDGVPFLVIPPDVEYTVSAPGNAWSATNDDVSGNQEWELFRIGDIAASVPNTDVEVPGIPAGAYTFMLNGTDFGNQFFLNTDMALFPPVTEACSVSLELVCSTMADPTQSSSCEVKKGDSATLEYIVTNTSNEILFDINVVDSTFGMINSAPFSLQPGESTTIQTQRVIGSGGLSTSADVEASIGILNQCDDSSSVEITLKKPNPYGHQGCPVDFWKNNTHKWGYYWPSDWYYWTFHVYYHITLWDALHGGGTPKKDFAREAVAALLNSQHYNGIYYKYSKWHVKNMVQDAFWYNTNSAYNYYKDKLEWANNDTYCPYYSY